MAAGVEAVFGVVFDAPAVAAQHRTCGQRRAVTAGDAGVVGRVAGEDFDPATLASPNGGDAVGERRGFHRPAVSDLAVREDDGDRFGAFHVEVAAVDGHVGPGLLAQPARGPGRAFGLYDERGESPPGVDRHGEGLLRAEELRLRPAGDGAAAQVGGLPFGLRQGGRIAGRLGRRRQGGEEQQGSRQFSQKIRHGVFSFGVREITQFNPFAQAPAREKGRPSERTALEDGVRVTALWYRPCRFPRSRGCNGLRRPSR